MPIPEVVSILSQIESIHTKKNEDYAARGKDFENFERSAQIASWFNDPIWKPYAVLIGVKLARLATLLNQQAQPNNESIDDSFLDLDTYCILMHSQYKRLIPSLANKALTLEMHEMDQLYKVRHQSSIQKAPSGEADRLK